MKRLLDNNYNKAIACINTVDCKGLEQLVCEYPNVVTDVGCNGETLLMRLLTKNFLGEKTQFKMAKIIMQSNKFDIHQRNLSGTTVLHRAADFGLASVFELFVRCGANINAKKPA